LTVSLIADCFPALREEGFALLWFSCTSRNLELKIKPGPDTMSSTTLQAMLCPTMFVS
jgi:hypothetical protein